MGLVVKLILIIYKASSIISDKLHLTEKDLQKLKIMKSSLNSVH